jgi:hypothetical protein
MSLDYPSLQKDYTKHPEKTEHSNLQKTEHSNPERTDLAKRGELSDFCHACQSDILLAKPSSILYLLDSITFTSCTYALLMYNLRTPGVHLIYMRPTDDLCGRHDFLTSLNTLSIVACLPALLPRDNFNESMHSCNSPVLRKPTPQALPVILIQYLICRLYQIQPLRLLAAREASHWPSNKLFRSTYLRTFLRKAR